MNRRFSRLKTDSIFNFDNIDEKLNKEKLYLAEIKSIHTDENEDEEGYFRKQSVNQNEKEINTNANQNTNFKESTKTTNLKIQIDKKIQNLENHDSNSILKSSLTSTSPMLESVNNENIENNNHRRMSDLNINNDNESTTNLSRKSSAESFKNTNKILSFLKKGTMGRLMMEKHLVINLDKTNIKEKDDEGRNIVHRACFQLKSDIVLNLADKLVQNNMLDELDNYQNTALILACKTFRFNDDNENRNKILNMLASKGANLDLCESVNGWTALHWLSYIGDEKSFQLLISKGAVYFIPDKMGYFPIDLAGVRGHTKIVVFIIQQLFDFLDKLGEFEVLDPKKLSVKIKKGEDKNKDFIKKESIFGTNLNILNLLNINNSAENEDEEDGNNKEKEEEDHYIVTNLELVNPYLQTLFVKIMINHCLYWASFFKINNEYINKLLTVHKAEPNFQIFCMSNQTAIHAACVDGNLMGLKLLLNKLGDNNEILENIKNNKNLNINMNTNKRLSSLEKLKYPSEKSNKIMLPLPLFKRNNLILENLVITGYTKFHEQEVNNIKKSISKDQHYVILNKNFKKYLFSNLKHILYNEKNSNYKSDFLELLDDNMNNPIHLASINGKIKFIKELFESNLIETNLDSLLNSINKESYSGYALLKDEEFKNKILTEASKKLHNIPSVVLELFKGKETNDSINLIIKIAIAEKLQVSLLQHKDKTRVYLCIDITDSEFRSQAEKSGLKIKLLDKSLKKIFENKEEFINSVEPFYSRMRQEVISKVISNILDMKLLMDQKILIGVFYTHKPNVVIKITKIWLDFKWYFPNPIKLFLKFIINDKKLIYEEIDLLYRYFGEKTAIYYTFVSFYINYLLFIALLSLGMLFYYQEKVFVSYSMFPTYCCCFLIWSIIMVEMWKRKISEITHKWGINDISSVREMRAEFKGDEYYKDINGKFEKHYEQTKSIFLFLLSLPVIIGLLTAVIIIFSYATEFQQEYESHPYIKYVPGIVKSLSITIINNLYDRIAYYFTNLENHKYEDTYENAMIAKLFTFRLVSDLTAVLYTTLVEQNVENLKALLYSLIGVKIISEVVTNIGIPYLKIKFFRQNYFEDVNKDCKEYSELQKKRSSSRKTLNALKRCLAVNMKTDSEEDEDEGNKIIVENNNYSNKEQKEVIIENLNFDKETEILKSNNNLSLIYNNDLISASNKNLSTKKINNNSTRNTPTTKLITKTNTNNLLTKSKSNNLSKFNSINSVNEKNNDTNFYRKVKIVSGNKNSTIHNTINPDQIELNNMLFDKKDIVYYYADICIIFTISSLFAIIIPLAPFIVLLGTIVSHNFKLYGDLYLFKRHPAKRASNIGLWLNIFDVITTASIMFNAFLFYYYNDNTFNTYTNIITKQTLISVTEEYNVGKGENALLVIALAEHVLIMLKYFLKYVVSDTPSWVVKERDLLMAILEESNKTKDEEHNKGVDGVINNYFDKFKLIMKNKDKKIERRDLEIKMKDEKIDSYIEELEKNRGRINEFEYINKVLMDKMTKIHSEKELSGGLNINNNLITLCDTIDKTGGIKFNSNNNTSSDKNFNISSPKINPINNLPFPKYSIQEYEEAIDFRFDGIFEKMTKEILQGRKIVLEEDVNQMKKVLNKIYIFNLMKNTFDRIEKEILSKKFGKCLTNIDKPIILCNLCSIYKAVFYCIDCDEKICLSCNSLHASNNLWAKHKIETFSLPEYGEMMTNLHNHNSDNNFNKTEFFSEDAEDLKQKIFRRKTVKPSEKGDKNKLKDLLKNLNNPNIKSRKNFISRIKDKNSKENLNSTLQSPCHNDYGMFVKMENFCFPTQVHNLNYENLKFYFELLYKEYIVNNGISSDNLVDSKILMENKIDNFAKLNENPLSVLNDDFTNKICNVAFNFEEQFLINRIAFMKFKQFGANLQVNKIFDVLKQFQSSSFEEKFRILLNMLDIYDNKLILKSEFEKLLVFVTLQNHKPHYRINNLIDEIFGKKIFIKYEDIYTEFLNKSLCREVLCELLQFEE